jgi:lysozyme
MSFFEYPLHYREYKHFGIRIPGDYAVHGIDVSRWQAKIDWARVKKMNVDGIRVRFAFIKATEGAVQDDPQFAANWVQARKHGIIRGAYHFFHPKVSAKVQAINFARAVDLQPGDLPPVVDVEEDHGMSREQVRRATKEMLTLLERHYGVKPILYTGRDFYKQYFANQPEFKPYVLWIAHYHVAELTMPDESEWHFWQHSDRGNINGINEKVDFNVFAGDTLALQRLLL